MQQAQHPGMMMGSQYPVIPPELQHFVAGPTRLERNPLSAPQSTGAAHVENPKHVDGQVDFRNPDAQHQRYRQMIGAHYYDLHANSAANTQAPQNNISYQPPSPFNYYH